MNSPANWYSGIKKRCGLYAVLVIAVLSGAVWIGAAMWTNTDRHSERGFRSLEAGDFDAAKSHFRNAIADNPESASGYHNLGTVFLLEGKDPDRTEELFLKALAMDNTLLRTRLNLANLYIIEGRTGEAIAVLEKNLTVDPHEESTLFELVRIHLQKGPAEAVSRYANDLLQHSNSAPLLTSLGSLLAQHGHSHAAFPCYVKAQQLDNFYPDVYVELGKLYGNWNMLPQAISVWRDGLLAAPADPRFKPLIEQARRLLEEKKSETLNAT